MAMASSGTWEVEMEKMIKDTVWPWYVETKRRRLGRHSIYRVPEYIKEMTNRNAYRPQLVSLGPFHHGDPARAAPHGVAQAPRCGTPGQAEHEAATVVHHGRRGDKGAASGRI